MSIAKPISFFANINGLPLSRDSNAANSSMLVSIKSAILLRTLDFSLGYDLLQGPSSNALLADYTALCTSSYSASYTEAMTSPVLGLSVSNVLPEAEFTNFPFINS